MKKTPSKDSVFSTCSEAQSSETFAVGETVKVGERIGRVAFVGRTQFQPGEWVGLILDTPDGKNNGSVNGIKYFECNERHGLFCRPSKLVKIRPTLSSVARSPRVPPAVSVAGARSPTNSVYSVAFSVANSQAGGSRERSPYAAQFGFDIGDRVIVDDGRAGKIKFLNYVADQIFAGIVLDRPLGDSDGKFQGIQYFKCYPKYATFLPAHLLKKAATTIASSALPPRKTPRPTKASQLRTDKGALLGGMTFKGSRESLDSLMRSPPPGHIHASSCVKLSPTGIKDSDVIVSLKKCLQEKEAHLAKLSIELSERSNDADRLAHENLNLKLRISELDADLNATERQLALKSQEMQRGIDERDKRLDDLSFCFTEAELKKEELEQRMKEMSKSAMPTLYEEDKPKMIVFERQSDQADLIDSEMQTETEEKTKMTNELASTETQTEPEEKPKTVTFAMQTDQTDLVNSEMQTETAEKPKITNKLITTAAQTEPEEKPKTFAFGLQTDQTGLIDSEMQTVSEEKPKTVTFAMQTVQTDLVNSEMQTLSEEKPKMTNDEVLELNVSKLPMDADSSFLSNQGRSSPLLDESLRRKYNEKCEEMAELRHAYEFQQSIISNQLDEIARLKQQQQLRNGVQKNGSPSSTRHPTITAAASPSSVFPSGALPTISGRPRAARRTYCEHCEMFDAHDSSECPKEEAKRAERRDHEALSPQKWDERERTFWH